MDQKRGLEQNTVSGKLFLVGFLVLFAVIGLLLYLNPNETSVFDGKEVRFEGVTGAATGNSITGAVVGEPQCVDVPDGLVGWWPMDDITGGKTQDFSGNNYDGTVGGTTKGEGQVDGALNFDGEDDYVSILEFLTLSLFG
jgi:hypothetical protein